MRCPECNKFVSQEPGEPEVLSEDLQDDGHWTVSCSCQVEPLAEGVLEDDTAASYMEEFV